MEAKPWTSENARCFCWFLKRFLDVFFWFLNVFFVFKRFLDVFLGFSKVFWMFFGVFGCFFGFLKGVLDVFWGF